MNAAHAPMKEPKKSALTLLAEEAFERHRNDYDAATEWLFSRVSRSKEALEEAAHVGCREMVHRMGKGAKDPLRLKVIHTKPGHPRASAESIKVTSDALETWYVARAKKYLTALTRQELEDSAEYERGLSNGHAKNAEFYGEIAGMVPEGKTVGESVKMKKLREIRDKIFG